MELGDETNNLHEALLPSDEIDNVAVATENDSILVLDEGCGAVNDLKEEGDIQSTGEAILSIAIPALAALAIDPLMTLADTVFVGRTSDDAYALAGMGSAAALLTFSFYLFNFLCTVTTPLVSRCRAGGDLDGAIQIGKQSLSLALVIGGVLSCSLITFSQPLLEVMGADSNNYATSFLNLRAIAAPAVFFISASTGILRGFLDTRTTFLILLGANVINFILDVILISYFKMGPFGAAVATTSAEWICAISLFFVLSAKIPSADRMLGSNQRVIVVDRESASPAQNQDMIVITPTFNIPDWEAIRPLVVASSSVFVRSFLLQLSIAGAAAVAARSGGSAGSEVAASSIAAHQIALQLWLLCSFICDALAAASQTLVADRLGCEDTAGVRNISRTIFLYSLGLGFILSAALGFGEITGFLINIFTNDGPTQKALEPLLTILIFAQPLNSFVFAADGVLQGASEFSYQAKSMIFSVSIGLLSFLCLQNVGVQAELGLNALQCVWYSLVSIQLIRGFTSLLKLVDSEGPIDLLYRAQEETGGAQ